MCSCKIVKRQNSVKYLGLLFDQHLSYAEHISTLAARARKLIYVMKRLRDCAPRDILRLVYHALGQSILQYGVAIWGCAAKSHMILLERAQRAVIKVMLRKPYRYPTNLLYRESKFLRVRQLYIIKAVTRTHSTIFNTARHDELLQKRIYKVPLPPYRSALARRSPAYAHCSVYNHICKSSNLNIKLLSVPRAKSLVVEWLYTLTYEETESIMECTKITNT